MQNDKTATLLGFAVKAGKLVYGTDAIEESGKRLYLILACLTLAPNSLKRLERAAAAKKIPLLIPKEPLENILHKPNCKAAALKDRQMAEAIIKNINDNYTFKEFAEETT